MLLIGGVLARLLEKALQQSCVEGVVGGGLGGRKQVSLGDKMLVKTGDAPSRQEQVLLAAGLWKQGYQLPRKALEHWWATLLTMAVPVVYIPSCYHQASRMNLYVH